MLLGNSYEKVSTHKLRTSAAPTHTHTHLGFFVAQLNSTGPCPLSSWLALKTRKQSFPNWVSSWLVCKHFFFLSVFAISDIVQVPVDCSATLWAVRTYRIRHQLSYGGSLLPFLWKHSQFLLGTIILTLFVLDEGSEHFKDSLKLAGGREWLVKLSVIHRSPALLTQILIKDLCALAPGLIMVTSCFIEVSYLCFREGMIRGELGVCLALFAAIFLPFNYTLFSNNKHQVWRHGRISMKEGRTVETSAAGIAMRTHGITGASSVCRMWRKLAICLWGNGLCAIWKSIKWLHAMTLYQSSWRAPTAHSLILFNFLRGEKAKGNVLVSLKLISLCFFLKVPF